MAAIAATTGPRGPAPPPVETKPKPKRLRPGKAHRTALLEAVPAEQRPIAEQLLQGGIPAVRQAIEKQNEELKAEGKPEVKADPLLRVAEELRYRAAAAVWRDRAEAAVAVVDELDLRDLRSVVNAAGDAGRDDEARALAAQLREALANRVEKEHAAWLAELAETVAGRAGGAGAAPQLASAQGGRAHPRRRRHAARRGHGRRADGRDRPGPLGHGARRPGLLARPPAGRPAVAARTKLSPDLRGTIARLASRLPEIAHIFAIEPEPAADRAAPRGRPAAGPPGASRRRRPSRSRPQDARRRARAEGAHRTASPSAGRSARQRRPTPRSPRPRRVPDRPPPGTDAHAHERTAHHRGRRRPAPSPRRRGPDRPRHPAAEARLRSDSPAA